jgi:plasmid maintenance system antidote protein VapI
MPVGDLTDYPIPAVDAGAMLAMKARQETLPAMAERLHIPESRLVAMIEGKEPLSRRVMRDLGLRREIRYREVNNESL